MPVLVPKELPAYDILKRQGVFVMTHERARTQDIRPLKIAIVNLMPTLEATETQLIRMMANTPLQLDLYLLTMDTDKHQREEDQDHLRLFYQTFDEIKNQKFDGMLITGAPLEKLAYEEVDYWKELTEIMDYTKQNVFSTMHICWGAQAALYYHYGINKRMLPEKLFGVFPHTRVNRSCLTRGFDDVFYVPHSRHSQVLTEDIEKVPQLKVLAESPQAGPHLCATRDHRWIFVQGHWEYERDTLEHEYRRDLSRGLADVQLPYNYFIDNDPEKGVQMNWKSHGNIFYTNWLNFVYQSTPFDLEDLNNMIWEND